MLILVLFGGMALLLYGIQLVGEGFQRAAGGRLRYLLTHLTRNRFTALLSGAAVTAIIQSSSATTVMLIGFVAAGLIPFSQTMGVILGADIGTTFTVQLIAFKITDYALLLVGLGFSGIFLGKRRAVKDLGTALLGFGLIFLGLKVMVEGMTPLKSSHLAQQILVTLAGTPLAGILTAAFFSGLVQSSAATIALAITLAGEGHLPLSGAVAIVLGANIGTCAAALMASMGARPDAKRVAAAHIAFKVLGVLLIFPFIDPFTRWIATTAGDVGRQIANAHTVFNVGISVLFLPFQNLAARLIVTLVPEEEEGDNPFKTRYLDERSLDQPALAIGQATREALRMADVVQGMYRDAMTVFRTDNQELLENVEQCDDQVDFLEREIKLFLTRLGRETMSADLSRRAVALLTFNGNLENIGDIVDKNLMDLARKKTYQGRRFSGAGEAEIMEFHALVAKNLERAIAAFAANDRTLAQEVLDQRPVVRQRERELRESHLARLRAGLSESLETSEIHLDVLTNLKRISSHVTALVFPILEEA